MLLNIFTYLINNTLITEVNLHVRIRMNVQDLYSSFLVKNIIKFIVLESSKRLKKLLRSYAYLYLGISHENTDLHLAQNVS